MFSFKYKTNDYSKGSKSKNLLYKNMFNIES